ARLLPLFVVLFLWLSAHRDDPFFFFVVFADARSSASNRASRVSNLAVHLALCLAIHAAASSSGSGLMDIRGSRPARRRGTSRAPSSTRICFETALSDIAKGSATSVTRASPRESRCRIARRVGSASAIKVWFNPDCVAAVIIIQPVG